MRMFHKSLTPLLCNKHLIGAHGELHKHQHSFAKRHSITGRITPVVQIEPWRMEIYHDELVIEMVRRGMKHASPYELPDLSYLPVSERWAMVSREENVSILTGRCKECAKRMREGIKC